MSGNDSKAERRLAARTAEYLAAADYSHVTFATASVHRPRVEARGDTAVSVTFASPHSGVTLTLYPAQARALWEALAPVVARDGAA